MKRFFCALFALAAITFSSGCCGWFWPHWGWHGPPATYGSPAGACPGGACGVPSGQVTPGQVVPEGSYYQGSGSTQSVQMGVPQPVNGPVTAVPAGYAAQPVHRTAAMPLESLPTY